jgi:Ca2+-binding RTX toxin-like protein
MPHVNNSTQLRNAIQGVTAADPVITLNGSTDDQYSVLSLAQRSGSGIPRRTNYDGYKVEGTNTDFEFSAKLLNTRIYQQNVDGNSAPGTVRNLTFNYTLNGAADNGALFSITAPAPRTITLDNLWFKGAHKGWNGNGNLYMSLRSTKAAVPLVATFTLSNSLIAITGQANGFQNNFGATSGGSAFIHNWNNNAVFTLSDNNFDESGFLSSFNLTNYTSVWGSALISGNSFYRTTNKNVRWEGNRLQNVDATLTNNTFLDGSYLDLYGSVGLVKIQDGNFFDSIDNGYAIRTSTSSAPVFSGTNSFTGHGLALKNTTAAPVTFTTTGLFGFFALGNSFPGDDFNVKSLIAGTSSADTLTGVESGGSGSWLSGDGGNDTINGSGLNDIIYGGSGDDSISANDGNDWIYGGDGNDTITGGAGDDIIAGGVGADTLTGGSGVDRFSYDGSAQGVDNITDFTDGADFIDLKKETPNGNFIFADSNPGSTLNAADLSTFSSMSSATSTASGKVIVLTSSVANTDAALNRAGVTNAYVLVLNTTSGINAVQLLFDDNWSTNADRNTLATFAAGVSASNFTAADFSVWI